MILCIHTNTCAYMYIHIIIYTYNRDTLSFCICAYTGYRLVVICSSHEEVKSPIISQLDLYRRPYGVPTDITRYQQYLKGHFVDETQLQMQQLKTAGIFSVTASVVDPERCVVEMLVNQWSCIKIVSCELSVSFFAYMQVTASSLILLDWAYRSVFTYFLSVRSCVRVVSSTRAGMGKTLFVTQMAKKLHSEVIGSKLQTTIPVHGPHVSIDSVMQYLINHCDSSYATILHFDISPLVKKTIYTESHIYGMYFICVQVVFSYTSTNLFPSTTIARNIHIFIHVVCMYVVVC